MCHGAKNFPIPSLCRVGTSSLLTGSCKTFDVRFDMLDGVTSFLKNSMKVRNHQTYLFKCIIFFRSILFLNRINVLSLFQIFFVSNVSFYLERRIRFVPFLLLSFLHSCQKRIKKETTCVKIIYFPILLHKRITSSHTRINASTFVAPSLFRSETIKPVFLLFDTTYRKDSSNSLAQAATRVITLR